MFTFLTLQTQKEHCYDMYLGCTDPALAQEVSWNAGWPMGTNGPRTPLLQISALAAGPRISRDARGSTDFSTRCLSSTWLRVAMLGFNLNKLCHSSCLSSFLINHSSGPSIICLRCQSQETMDCPVHLSKTTKHLCDSHLAPFQIKTPSIQLKLVHCPWHFLPCRCRERLLPYEKPLRRTGWASLSCVSLSDLCVTGSPMNRKGLRRTSYCAICWYSKVPST